MSPVQSSPELISCCRFFCFHILKTTDGNIASFILFVKKNPNDTANLLSTQQKSYSTLCSLLINPDKVSTVFIWSWVIVDIWYFFRFSSLKVIQPDSGYLIDSNLLDKFNTTGQIFTAIQHLILIQILLIQMLHLGLRINSYYCHVFVFTVYWH